MYIRFVFFNCLILLPMVFVVIWDEVRLQTNCGISFISTGVKGLIFLQYVLNGFSGIVSASLYIKLFFFSVCCLLWELRFKSLTNVFACWTVSDNSAPSYGSCSESRRRSPQQFLHHFCGTWAVNPHRPGVPRTQGSNPHPSVTKTHERL